MAGSSFRWKTGQAPTQVWKAGAAVYVARLDMAIGELLSFWAGPIEQTMKRDAPWTDQTANARQTLAAFAHKKSKTTWALVAKQEMFYGLFLELANGGKYQIVMPTLQTYYPRIWGSLQDVVR
ncbi:MAG: hypothetical protein K8L91_07945 [Anaerolineae bacterium]|nr:MAG: hypothetical protein F9K46_09035 [Anaerolineae bacterium]MBZ0316334.1 hypothetical protein [Anaerolineae bacterium]